MPVRTIENEEAMPTVADEILSILPQKKGANVLALSGELGAGKTAFVRALAEQLGVREHITSPTFVIMKTYTVPDNENISTLVHIDAYRVEDVREMDVLGIPGLMQQEKTLICIEWPEHIKELIPADALPVRFEAGENNEERTITYGQS
jgi:tRNA threonylcarbamoyladenosine biosynthesis protein TsaE